MTGEASSSRTTVQPGALTALLGELARAPDATGWGVPAQPGERIGRFEILREIGRGGFGVVYEARDTELGRSVAFKAIRAGSTDAIREQRALAEAEAAARLAHPNIVHLYDVGRCERGAFLIMELLRGETLDERLARGPLKVRDAVHVAVEISRGLAHAHEQGVVHRDLKPGNVFLCEDGQVKVLDFGLAYVFGRGGLSGGTPAYMAPEQARGEASDERADVYALGVIVHELVTGRRPFEDGERGIRDGVKPPDLPGAPAPLARLVARMLSRAAAPRPASGVEAYRQLAALQKSLEPRRLLWAGWSLAAAALLAAAAIALWTRAPPLPPGRLLVALADAENATGDSDLDGVSQLLSKALEQSKRVSLVARSRLLGVAREPGGPLAGRLAEGPAREAALKVGAHALIVPAVRRLEGGYEVSVRALDPSRNEALFTARERTAGPGGILDALDRLSDRARRALHESPRDGAEPRVRLAQFVPENAQARREYAEAERLCSVGLWDQGVDAYGRALAIDGSFALAHVGIAFALGRGGDLAAEQRHLEAAARLLDRVPPKDRLLVEAMRARLAGRFGEALDLWDRVIAEWPQEPAPYFHAGELFYTPFADVEGARPYFEKALELGGLPEGLELHALLALGRLDEALAQAERRAQASPQRVTLRDLSRVHRHRGETAAALHAARRALSLSETGHPGEYAFWSFVEADAIEELDEAFRKKGIRDPQLLALQGRRREALASFDEQAKQAPPEYRGQAALLRMPFVAGDGDGSPDLVWREIEAMFRSGVMGIARGAYLLAWLGDLDRGERLMRLFPDRDPRNFAQRMFRHTAEWRRGDLEGAARGLAGMAGSEPAYHLGEILLELGRDREAVEVFRRFRRAPEDNTSSRSVAPLYPRSLYLEAVALERLGERDEALRSVDRLLRIWRDADPGLRTLREAKALRARLAAGRSP